MPWELNGNAIGATNFLGTTNARPLVVKTGNQEALRVGLNGNVGIGTTGPLNDQLTVASSGGNAVVATTASSARTGVFGINSSTDGAQGVGGNGVFGLTTAGGGRGVFGANNHPSAGVGVQGNGPESG